MKFFNQNIYKRIKRRIENQIVMIWMARTIRGWFFRRFYSARFSYKKDFLVFITPSNYFCKWTPKPHLQSILWFPPLWARDKFYVSPFNSSRFSPQCIFHCFQNTLSYIHKNGSLDSIQHGLCKCIWIALNLINNLHNRFHISGIYFLIQKEKSHPQMAHNHRLSSC